uniref:Ig-like domain-containing protein n=1 Tax=Ornithorhynchus anatinus TaxID=9258 RepID=A0A6I8ND64_ORNAN
MGPEESKPHTPGGKTALSQETPQSAPDPAMGPGPVWLVVVCLLGAGPTDTGGAGSRVTQAPRYLVVQNGENVTLNCEQNMNHDYMFWYRQDPGLGLRLIHLSRNTDFTEPGDIPQGYSVSRKKKELFLLSLESVGLNQSSLYFCASS